jgi:hypothetical protein
MFARLRTDRGRDRYPEITYHRAPLKPGSIDYEPKDVGVLTARGRLGDYFGSLPFQTFVLTVTMLQAGKIKYIIFNGNALRYGSASIKGITLTGEFDPDNH